MKQFIARDELTKTLAITLLAVAAVVQLVSTAQAVDYTWNRSGNNSWRNAINWLPNTSYPRFSADTATFNLHTATASATPALNETVTINKLTVNQAPSLTNFGLTINPGSSPAFELNFTAPSGNAAYVENANEAPGSGSTVVNSIVRLNSNLDATVQGQLTFANVVTGAGGLNLSGPGVVTLSTGNTYGDGVGTTINASSTLVAGNTAGSATGTGPVVVRGTLAGAGFVGAIESASNVAVETGGRINPGAVAGIGELTVSGNVTLGVGSFLDVNIDDLGFDKLSINGAASIGGALNLILPSGFTAAPGTTYQILTASSGVTGTFTEIASSTANTWSVEYGANSVSLIAGIGSGVVYAADFDLDGDVDGNDLIRWKDNFGLATGAGKQQGDANSDGIVDGADFLAWQRELGSGVAPGGNSSLASVPEPTALTVLLAAAVALAPLHRTIAPQARFAARGETYPSA